MKVQYGKEVANHSGPESCGGAREGVAEALTGGTGGSAIEPRNHEIGTPTQSISMGWYLSARPCKYNVRIYLHIWWERRSGAT